MNPEMLIEYPDRGPDSGSAAPLSCWSDGERELFYELIRWYPKDFFKIASHITDKSTKDCVYFFYHTDKKVIAIQGTSIPRITRASRKKAAEKGIVDNTSPPAAARESEPIPESCEEAKSDSCYLDDVCRLGCVCQSLAGSGKNYSDDDHCQHPECMFDQHCLKKKVSSSGRKAGNLPDTSSYKADDSRPASNVSESSPVSKLASDDPRSKSVSRSGHKLVWPRFRPEIKNGKKVRKLKKKGHISFEIDEPKPADAQPLKVQSTDHNFSNTNTVSIQIGKNNFKNCKSSNKTNHLKSRSLADENKDNANNNNNNLKPESLKEKNREPSNGRRENPATEATKDHLSNLVRRVTCDRIIQVDVFPNENVRPKSKEDWNVDRVKKRRNQSPEKTKVLDIFDAEMEQHFIDIESAISSKKCSVQNSPSVDHCGSEPHQNNHDSDTFSSGSSTKSLPITLNEKKNNRHHQSNSILQNLKVTVDIININDGSNHLMKTSAKSQMNRFPIDVSLSQQVLPRGVSTFVSEGVTMHLSPIAHDQFWVLKRIDVEKTATEVETNWGSHVKESIDNSMLRRLQLKSVREHKPIIEYFIKRRRVTLIPKLENHFFVGPYTVDKTGSKSVQVELIDLSDDETMDD